MAENYKHLYHQTKLMLEKYQDEIVPGLRERIEKAKRPKGKWNEDAPFLECQFCGEVYSTLGYNEGKEWNFCPFCGADMRGDSE